MRQAYKIYYDSCPALTEGKRYLDPNGRILEIQAILDQRVFFTIETASGSKIISQLLAKFFLFLITDDQLKEIS